MKRAIYIIVLMGLLLSCAKDGNDLSGGSVFKSFTITSEGNTKTQLNSNMTIGWIKGDRVAINDGTDTHCFVAEPSPTTNRSASLYPSDGQLVLTAGTTYYALYPYDENAEWEENTVTFQIPSSFVPKANTFPYNPSVSSTTTSSIKFYNICSLIKFSFISDNITKVVFCGANGEDLAGKITVDCTDTTPNAVVVNGIRTITVEGNFESGKNYYVSVLPNDFKRGLSIILYDKQGNVITRSSQPFKLARSSRIEMGNVDDDQVWSSATDPVLFLNSEKAEQLRSGINGSLSAQWQRVKLVADQSVNKNPPAYKNDVGEQLWQRSVGSTISQLAFVGYLSGKAEYMQAAYMWAEASCSYPTWGTDDTEDGQEFGLNYGHQLLGLAMLYDYGKAYLTSEQLANVRATLISRTSRQYEAYIDETLNIITNHCWVNICGMLASAMVLQTQEPDAQSWIDFALSVIEKASRLLIKDGVSQEGPGYWQYGMEYLMMNYDLAKSLGKDYYANSEVWKHTAKYSKYFTLPMNYCSQVSSIINWGDSKHVSWYGPSHIFYKLASLNQDSTIQYWGDESVIYDTTSSWLNILWYDPSLPSIKPVDYPNSHHFEEMDIWASRTGWEGDETIVIYKCGAPLGKSVTSDSDYTRGNMGHCHPDAGHFCIYDSGEYIIKNTGYVKRQTKYHNVALFGGLGLWGESKGYFSPYPFTPEKYPRITDIQTDNDMDIIMSDMSASYMDAAKVKSYTRKFIWMKKYDAVVIVDDVACLAETDIQLNLYPQSPTGTCEGNLYTDETDIHKIRIENLSPSSTSRLTKESQFVENRNDKDGEDMVLLTIRDRLTAETNYSGRYVTAISWSSGVEDPVKVKYDSVTEEFEVDLGNNKIGNHEGFGNKVESFTWK